MARHDGHDGAERWFGQSADSLAPREKRVLELIGLRRPITSELKPPAPQSASFGDRMADRLAEIGGSWGFIVSFVAFLLAWAVINTVILASAAFDPYPYIFLNLVMSMLAAIQAPIIMMSQNRAAARDRREASRDYEVNLKAEIEILGLHDKLDRLRDLEISETKRLLAEIAERLERLERRGGGGEAP
ncbi:DUF1003 domain-containing protein [Aurantimonas sp. 22II-16-19i]|uniref:DUF1003 domain-containing protein n=1 Tax=Aurantimonas sp. 22II-16-19i TaxID=1317114 RepID=UPI0009F7F709|nr:DUF1003 domain-containing protein [Aurantimonas sp. 22II-16-19i]ORE97257.1 transmembrane protein [Aurantimonas sp. 22II-16-19i]